MAAVTYRYRCVACDFVYESPIRFLSSVEHPCPARNRRATLLKLDQPTSNQRSKP